MSVRRRLAAVLSAISTGAIGGSTTADTSTFGGNGVWGGTASAVTGTVTSVSARFAASGRPVRFFTTREVSGVWTIRAVTADINSVSGVSAYTVSLAIQPGDYLGVYDSGGSAGLRYATGSGSYWIRSTSGAPAAGSSYVPNSTDSSKDYAFVATP